MLARTLLTAALLTLALAPRAAAVGDQECIDCHDGARFARGLRASVHAEQKCGDCHKDVARNPHGKTAGAPTASASCVECHARAVGEYEKSAHAAAVRKGSKDAPTCAGCHGEPHGIVRHIPKGALHEVSKAPRDERLHREVLLCGPCHTDPEIARRSGINDAVVATYEESMHGARARLGHKDVPTCTGCHGLHEIISKSSPESRIHPDKKTALCASCHPGGDQNFAASFEHLPSTREAFPLAYWLKTAFTWLVVFVTGALALHTFLDFQATVRAKILRRRGSHAK